jgi:hypothetical protein
MDSILRSQLRVWLLQIVECHALIAEHSCAVSLDAVKDMVAELSDNDLESLANSPLRPGPADWQPTEDDWDRVAKFYARSGFWSRWTTQFGPDPTSKACRCPPAIRQRHGIDLETGELRTPAKVGA